MGPLATGLLAAGGAFVVLKMTKTKAPAPEDKGAAGSTNAAPNTTEPVVRNPPDPLAVSGASGQAPATGTTAPKVAPMATTTAPTTTTTAPKTAATCTTCPSTPTAGYPSTQELQRVMSLAAQSTRIVF